MNKLKHKLALKDSWLFIVCLLSLMLFLLMTVFRTSVHSIDAAINLWIPSIQFGALTFLAQAIDLIFDTTSIAVFSLVIAGFLFWKSHRAQGLFLLGAVAGDALLVSFLKTLEHVARPTNGIDVGSGYSYPSGHSAVCIVFVGILAYFAWRNSQTRRSKALIGIGVCATAGVVGFDRLYLGVHWFSDVIGGWLIGVFWLSFAVLVFRYLHRSGKFKSKRFNLAAKLLFTVAILVVILALLGRVLFNNFPSFDVKDISSTDTFKFLNNPS